MQKLFVVRHGIPGVGYSSRDGRPVKSLNYYLLSWNFISNVGYIGVQTENKWRLYTSLGAGEDMRSRYHHFDSFEECIIKLQALSSDAEVEIFDIDNYYQEFPTDSIDEASTALRSDYLDRKLFIWLQGNYVYNGIDLDDSARKELRLLSQLVFTQRHLFPQMHNNIELLASVNSLRIQRLEKLKKEYELELVSLRFEDIPRAIN